MPHCRVGALSLLFLTVWMLSVRGADPEPKAIVDAGIKALGGEEKLAKAAAFHWKVEGKVLLGDNSNPFSGSSTIQGLEKFRSDFEGDFGGNKFVAATVVNGDKGWRRFGGMTMELDRDALANEKRMVYLHFVPMTLLPLKSKAFQIDAAPAERVGEKEQLGLKVTGPDAKEFRLYFDKESHLPVRQVADVRGFMGEEFTQETTYEKYKAFDGIQKATHIESKRDGMPFVIQDLVEFKPLEAADATVFAEPR